MLLTISTDHRPATDLGFLLHKHPDRVQAFDLSFGRAVVAYPEATADRCTAALLLDVDPVALVRGRPDDAFALGQYVNDRPYVASSFLCVALSRVFGTALGGTCKVRPDLVTAPIPLEARLDVLPVRGGEPFLRSLFEPLGYAVEAKRLPLDPAFPDWGDSQYHSVTLRGTLPLAALLAHLYVLVPVFDGRKHYYIGEFEVEKLLAKGEGWLAAHPARETIARRYLQRRPSLVKAALAKLLAEDDEPEPTARKDDAEEALEKPLRLNTQRHAAVADALAAGGAARVIDLGCGEGKLLKLLWGNRQFREIAGMDVSIRALEIAARRLKLEDEPARVRLFQGSLVYRDKRLSGFDAAVAVEVIEHLDPPRLAAFARVVFEFARPKRVVLTTPNRDYNAMWETLPAGQFRHADHRFEWTRAEFAAWANEVAERFGYAVTFSGIGEEKEGFGTPTQMAVFELR